MTVTYSVNLALLVCTYFCAIHGRHITRQQSFTQRSTKSRVDAVPRNRVPEWNPSAWYQSYDPARQRQSMPVAREPVISRRPDDVSRFQNPRVRVNIDRRAGSRRRTEMHNPFKTTIRNVNNKLRINVSLNRPFGHRGIPRTLNHNIQITTGNQRRNTGIQISHGIGAPRRTNGLRNVLFPEFRKLSKSVKRTNTINTIKSDNLKPDTIKPHYLNMDTLKPDTIKSNTIKPDSVKPDTVKPDISNTHALKPETLKLDEKNVANLTPDTVDTQEIPKKVENVYLSSATDGSSAFQQQTTDSGTILKPESVISTKPVKQKVIHTHRKSLDNGLNKQSTNSDIISPSIASLGITDTAREVTTEEPDTPDSPDLPDLET